MTALRNFMVSRSVRFLFLWLLALTFCLPTPAQRGGQRQRGPRALALLEVPANGPPRLRPICIFVDRKFYDAGLYRATPRPLALEPGTVYEAESSGESAGLFTITSAAEVSGTWYGFGAWRPNTPAVAEESTVKMPETEAQTPSEDEPPILRRPGAAAESEQPAAGVKSAEPPSSASESNDEGRPVLRRGKPRPRAQEEVATTSIPSSEPLSASPVAPSYTEVLPAISDADGAVPRSFKYELRPDERRNYEERMRALAMQELEKFFSRRPNLPATSDLQQTALLYAFDLTLSNEPTLVYSARQPGKQPGIEYYVTVVARTDIYGELHQVFSTVTDTSRLNVVPRLEVVDVVDANGDGRGDLLFRQVWATRRSYLLAQIGMNTVTVLFQGAESR